LTQDKTTGDLESFSAVDLFFADAAIAVAPCLTQTLQAGVEVVNHASYSLGCRR
jgi:hypothetical protein